jgi:hypothetical protein
MTNSIAKNKNVAPANGRRSGLVEGRRDWPAAARRASAPTLNASLTATHGVGARW